MSDISGEFHGLVIASSVFMIVLTTVDQTAISTGSAVTAASSGLDSAGAGGVAICALLSSS